MLKQLALVFGLSMVPVAELRAAIPMGIAMDLPGWQVYIAAVIGNMIPVPLIVLFVRRVLAWMKTKEGWLCRFSSFLEDKAAKGAEKVYHYEMLGLLIFVAIPLPGTGAWTGAMAAGILNLRMRNSVPTILAGVAIAGLIMLGLSAGVEAGVNAVV